MTDPGNVTDLVLAWGNGDEAAFQRLVPLVERELQRIAKRCMAGERAGHSLQATALVNEAYLRLIDVQQVKWQDRAHFLAKRTRAVDRLGQLRAAWDEILPTEKVRSLAEDMPDAYGLRAADAAQLAAALVWCRERPNSACWCASTSGSGRPQPQSGSQSGPSLTATRQVTS